LCSSTTENLKYITMISTWYHCLTSENHPAASMCAILKLIALCVKMKAKTIQSHMLVNKRTCHFSDSKMDK
jgi:hypothetical protein